MSQVNPSHPLYKIMEELVKVEIKNHVSSQAPESAFKYLTDLLIQFIRTDNLFLIKNQDGKPLTSVIEMVAEGDVRINANSFDREREVHKHIGDFILFWSGIYPSYLAQFKLDHGTNLIQNYYRQGRESYFLVSTFTHGPYGKESETFFNLSEQFEAYSYVIKQLNNKLKLYAA